MIIWIDGKPHMQYRELYCNKSKDEAEMDCPRCSYSHQCFKEISEKELIEYQKRLTERQLMWYNNIIKRAKEIQQ